MAVGWRIASLTSHRKRATEFGSEPRVTGTLVEEGAMRRTWTRAGLFALLLVGAMAAKPARAGLPGRGTGGAVSCAEPLATAAGLQALRDGGNAVDAAVAAALMLAVTFPEAGNLGGGGFAVVRVGEQIAALDFREIAPRLARRDLFLDPAGEPLPGASTEGGLAVGVPGSPQGLHELHRRFGRLPWARVVEPARRTAAEGFVVGAHLNRRLGERDVRAKLDRDPVTAARWRPQGLALPQGLLLRQPELAVTLDRYAKLGPRGIMAGPVAAAVVAVARRNGGILTLEDLESYRSEWREPLRFERFGWQFAVMPLPSSGGVIEGVVLGLLERWNWAAAPRWGAQRWHLLAEAYRRAFADRMLLGDPSTTKVRVEDLLAPKTLEGRAATLDRERATPSSSIAPMAPDSVLEPEARRPATETTHLSVIDGEGSAVALTTTLNDNFGSGLWVAPAGFFLNDEMDDFTTAPGRPNLFRLIQGPANEVGPGKRMLSSMAPTLLWRDAPQGRETIAIGARGGSRIPTATIQAILSAILDGDDLQKAIERPRIHHQMFPDRIELEPDALSPETRSELERRGHALFDDSINTAKVHAVRRFPDGRFEAATDTRGPGAAKAVVEEVP